jgi:hypothetical protein
MMFHPAGFYEGPVARYSLCACCLRRRPALVLFSDGYGAPFPICADRAGCDRFRRLGARLADKVRGVLDAQPEQATS